MSGHEMTKPAAGEDIVWRHSEENLNSPKWGLVRVRQWGVVSSIVIFVIYIVIWCGIVYFSEVMEVVDLSLSVIFGAVLSLIFGPMLRKYVQKKIQSRGDIDGVPLWMSRERILFNPTSQLDGIEVSISDIRSATSGYAAGSPAVVLELKQKTVSLISSEAGKLLEQIYILRPDLNKAGA